MASNLKISGSNCHSLERLKNLRGRFNRHFGGTFFCQFHDLIRDWEGERPNLRDIFEPREIELIIKDCIKQYDDKRAQIIEFVASTGYRYEPEIDEGGGQQQQQQQQPQQLLLRRATPIHYAAAHRTRHLDFAKRARAINELFKIYDRFDVNYANESGYTHFHAAVGFSLVDVVAKFLDRGQDPNLCVEKTGDSPLHLALATGNLELIELLLRRGADPNRANKQGSTPLHVVGKHFKDSTSKDVARMLFELSDERYRPLRVDAQDKLGNTPLHCAVKCVASHKSLMEFLLRNGADSNAANKEGETPLYIICRRSTTAVLAQLFFKINDELNRTVRVDARAKSGDAALHAVLSHHRKQKVLELLARRGANPNLANEEGHTALHLLCKVRAYDDELINTFFSINDKRRQLVQIDARDKSGETPLHLALRSCNKVAIESLLRRGANPNSVNEVGETSLHAICKSKHDRGTMNCFFELIKENQLTVPIDAQDHFGNTPLHLALAHCNETAVESLLRRGANPNLANRDGSTCLHIICRTKWYVDNAPLVKSFFRISDEMGQSMLVDARDKLGRTPLEWAVGRVWPNMVDLFLDRGADLSSFVFPAESHFDELFRLTDRDWDRFGLASGILCIVEHLEKRGYDLDRNDALSLMKVLGKYSFDIEDLDERWYHVYEDDLKEVEVKPSLSLYDLMRLESKEAAQLLSYSDYFKLGRGLSVPTLLCYSNEGRIANHLREKVSREFFIGWALEPFWALLHERLPLDCCEIIVRKLANKDLLNICLATAGQRDKESEHKKRKFDAACDECGLAHADFYDCADRHNPADLSFPQIVALILISSRSRSNRPTLPHLRSTLQQPEHATCMEISSASEDQGPGNIIREEQPPRPIPGTNHLIPIIMTKDKGSVRAKKGSKRL